jgi:16S rRNA (guanine527-N7)-methyltransferase
VDTVAKKAAFIQQAAAALRCPTCMASMRGSKAWLAVDVVSCRAFASLQDFTAWSRSALAPQGVWLAMKGKHPAGRMAALPGDVQVFHVEHCRCQGWMPSAASSGCIRHPKELQGRAGWSRKLG